jgi:general L-amino acid transport system permease protein
MEPAILARRTGNLRAIVSQGAVLAIAAFGAWWLIDNARTNLQERHIAAGFGFLRDMAGFGISEGLMPYDMADPYWRAFLAGVMNTLRAALPAVMLLTALGMGIGIAQISRHAMLRKVAQWYVDLVRNVPLLVQVLLWYFALTELLPTADRAAHWGNWLFLTKGGLAFAQPDVNAALAIAIAGSAVLLWVGIRQPRRLSLGTALLLRVACVAAIAALWLLLPVQWTHPEQGAFGFSGGAVLSPEWLALVLALSIYGSAYCAEVVRAGLQAVPRGQWEAAHATGLSWRQSLIHVILPQGLRVMVPPYTSLVMNTIKNSSLAVAIGYPDIVSVATTAMNQTGQAIECIAVIAMVYLALNLKTAIIMGFVNTRVQIRER